MKTNISDKMNKGEIRRIAKYLCYLLRHAPDAVSLDMDEHGWVKINQLIENVNARGKTQLTMELLQEIVATDDKGRYRFSPDDERIKACQGHSIPWVEPELEQRTPPEYLYHGTTMEALEEIRKTGAILRMSRHAVHLHADENTAWQVAKRRKNKTPVVLKINTAAMTATGFTFSISENGVWFCDQVSTKYICQIITDGKDK